MGEDANSPIETKARGPLEIALAARDTDGVRAAIAAGADVNAPFADGLTPLCRAAALGERRILKHLLAAGADIDAGPHTPTSPSSVADQVVVAGFAALHWACREGKLECAKMLVEANAMVDIRATDSVTPFMLACKSAHLECAKMLMRAGADVEAANARGGTAMVVACVMGADETVRQLLAMRANADALTVAVDDTEELFQCRPLTTACRYNFPKCVSLLLGAGVSTEAMTTALVELEAFPSFAECAKLVRRAAERKGALPRGGKARAVSEATPSADGAAALDAATAEARAEAAMAALLAEEASAPKGGKPPKGKGGAASAAVPVGGLGAGAGVGAAAADKAKKKKRAKKRPSNEEEEDRLKEEEKRLEEGGRPAGQLETAAADADGEADAEAPSPTGAESVDAEEAEEAADEGADAERGVTRGEESRLAEEAWVKVGRRSGRAPSAESGKGSARDKVLARLYQAAEPDREENMNALVGEYRLYQGDASSRGGKAAAERAEKAAIMAKQQQQDAEEYDNAKEAAKASDSDAERSDDEANEQEGSEGEGPPGRQAPAAAPVATSLLGPLIVDEEPSTMSAQLVDGKLKSSYDELDRILQRQEMCHLDLFLHRKKFTTSAMTFFLTKVREGRSSALQASSKLQHATPQKELVTVALPKIEPTHRIEPTPSLPAPPTAPTAPLFAAVPSAAVPSAAVPSVAVLVPSEPLTMEERRRRKARRPPPPPGCAPSPPSSSSSTWGAPPPLPIAPRAAGAFDGLSDDVDSELFLGADLSSYEGPRLARSGSTTSLDDMERRLEQELEAAREREAVLQAALRQRSERLTELVVCPITHEPMQDPVSAADGQTYERCAIEEWLKKENAISPLTGEPLKDKTLRPNFLARALAAGR